MLHVPMILLKIIVFIHFNGNWAKFCSTISEYCAHEISRGMAQLLTKQVRHLQIGHRIPHNYAIIASVSILFGTINDRKTNTHTEKKEIISALRSLYPPTQKTEFTFHSAFSAWTQKDEQSRSKKMANINGKIFVYFSLSSSIMWTTSNIKLSGNTKAFNVW